MNPELQFGEVLQHPTYGECTYVEPYDGGVQGQVVIRVVGGSTAVVFADSLTRPEPEAQPQTSADNAEPKSPKSKPKPAASSADGLTD